MLERKVSISSPFFPITIPGRAVKIVIFAFFAGRSIKILLTAAFDNFLFKNSLTFISLFKNAEKFFEFAYHLDDQFFDTPKRKPIGFIFCPIIISFNFLRSQ